MDLLAVCNFTGYRLFADFECFFATEHNFATDFERNLFEILHLENAAICPNFFDRVTGLKLRWYRYPLRDSYANYNLTREMLAPILERLVEECREHGATPYVDGKA